MKKLTLILAVIGMITLQSCSTEEDTDTDTIAETYELRNVNFGADGNNQFSIYETLTPQIAPADVILIYRLSGTIDSSTPIWQQIPRTLYLNEGELDYDFDFSREDFTIYAGGTYDLTLTPNYLQNQTFRLVIIPAYASNKVKNVDLSDYDAVVKAYNIEESNIKQLK